MITEIAKITGIPVDDILGKSRLRQICEARQFYWMVLNEQGFSFSEIGRLSGKSHAAVMSGIRNIKELLSADKKIKIWYDMSKTIKR